MHVYGELHGTLTSAGLLHGTLVGDHHKIQGTLTIPSVVGAETYAGPYEVTPKAWEAQTLATKDKLMAEDVTVFKVPYYETSNLYDGLTVFIAEDTNG
jgi:hypothetical protein